MEKNFYSIPFVYVGQNVRVRLTDKMVEVFSEDSQPLSAHSRLTGVGKFSTSDCHYPEQKLSVARFEVHHAKEQAQKLGPHVEKLVEKLLLTDYPLRHLRRVQGILRLAKRHPITAFVHSFCKSPPGDSAHQLPLVSKHGTCFAHANVQAAPI